MFRSENIFRSVVIIPRDCLQVTIAALHQKKVCQIKKAETELHEIEPVEDEERILHLYTRLEFVLENLQHYSPKKSANPLKELFSSSHPKVIERTPLSKEDLYSKSEECLDIVEAHVRTNVHKLKEISENKDKNDYLISSLQYLPDMPTDVLKDTPNQKKIVGIVANSSLGSITEQISEKAIVLTEPIDNKVSLIIVICPQKLHFEIEPILHQAGFDSVSFPFENNTPREIITRLKNENMELISQQNATEKEQHRIFISYYSVLNFFHSQLRSMKEKIEALRYIKTTDSFSVLECWIPEKHVDSFKQCLDSETKGYYLEYDQRKDAPTLLKNPAAIRPFEAITQLYSLPKYKDFDPTPVLAITFSLFFGFMLTDFAYGLILSVFGILLIRGKGSYNETIKNIGIVLTAFGIFTLVLGMAFGSYFGDLFQSLGIQVPMLVDSLKQVMIVLVIALSIGMLHLLTGLIIGFLENMRKGEAISGIKDQGVWIFFIFSIISFIFRIQNLGYTLLGLSLITQIGLSYKEGGGVTALLSIFSFPGFLGDLFSYGRLMALAIGTTGIALAVNFMTLMLWNIPYIGPIIAILVFLGGHIFNMAMNGLGAFVHTIRLHFLEFFQKFYEGAGRKYVAFGSK